MDFLKKVVNEVESASKTQGNSAESNGKTENNGTSAILGAINGALGGGEKGEKKEGTTFSLRLATTVKSSTILVHPPLLILNEG